MNTCREELTEMEKELLQLRRDSTTKTTQLSQMEETLQETRGMLDKKSEIGTLDQSQKCSNVSYHRAGDSYCVCPVLISARPGGEAPPERDGQAKLSATGSSAGGAVTHGAR